VLFCKKQITFEPSLLPDVDKKKISIKRIQKWGMLVGEGKSLCCDEHCVNFLFCTIFSWRFPLVVLFGRLLQRVSSSRLFEAALIWPFSLARSFCFPRVFGREFCAARMSCAFWARLFSFSAAALFCFCSAFWATTPRKSKAKATFSDNSTRPIRGYLPKT